MREQAKERRIKDHINAAIAARTFEPEETLAMGIDLIDFSVRFSNVAKEKIL